MATQDNQISDKRRRLFKALSAAPVVATLQPGEALANHSSIQCAAKEMALPHTKYYKDASSASCSSPSGGPPGSGCHAFLEKPVWDPAIIPSGEDPDPNAFWLGKFVVRTDTSVFYWIDEDDDSFGAISPGSVGSANGITFDGSSMGFYDANSVLIKTVSSASTGLFVAIGGPDSPTDPTTWTAHTVWPHQETTVNNVLGGSCLTSFGGSSGFTLADS